MRQKANRQTRPRKARTRARWSIAEIVAAIAVVLLATVNLTAYPVTWYDEGSHLHVPKTLVRFGVYADRSSEGFRHYGPTIGLGPTVMLPIAAVFRLFGVGLLQARLVMALFLVATVLVFYRLAHILGGRRLAWIATALLVASRSVSLVTYGRQVLGEVPGFAFVVAGLVLWFVAWEKSGWGRLVLVGLLLGLAMITKYQYLLILGPTLGLAWIANLVYYRTVPQRVFIVPGSVAAACFALWQVYMIVYLGPATIGENWQSLRQFSSGAALVFSPELMKQGVKALLGLQTYLGTLVPALAYGLVLALPRRREGQQWGVLYIMVFVNLAWYVVASVGWLRYAFLGLGVSSLFVARFFSELIGDHSFDLAALRTVVRRGPAAWRASALRWTMLAWLLVMILLPLGQTVVDIVSPPFNAPAAMADYLDQNVPTAALVETWEVEMGFLTDHDYHYPPQLLLNTAVGYMWYGGPAPVDEYRFVQTEAPDYVLVGEFSRWVGLYPDEVLAERYKLVTSIGAYELYRREG